MMKKSIRLGWIGCACACLVAALAVGCSLYANDRAFLSDAQYGVARQMYLQTGSLDLVKRQLLQDMEWRRSAVNEAVYRLQKEFEVLPEEIPALAAEQAPATRAAAPATSGTTSLTLPATPGAPGTTTLTPPAPGGQPITLNPSAAAPAPTSATQTLPLPPPPAAK